MKILQTQTTTNPFSVPTHSFITPKLSIPLRRMSPTFSSTLPQFTVTCRRPYPFQPKQSPPPPSSSSSSSSSVGELPAKVYVGHSVYKAKAVLTVSPRPPQFTTVNSGSGAFKISRVGSVMLEFAPAADAYQYDWNRKQVFSLSVDEMGNLIRLRPRESCEFFHDLFIGKSDEGKVTKVLKVEPLLDRSGHMFKISVQNKIENINESILIPVTKAEFAVFKSLFDFIMPRLLGWNVFANTIKPEVNNANQGIEEDFEWNRFNRIM